MTTSSNPKTKQQNLSHRLHKYFGVTVGFYILLMSLTGTSLVFSDEILGFVEPKVKVASPSDRVSLELITDRVRKKYQGFTVSWLHLQKEPDSPIEVHLSRGNERVIEFVDPYNGKLLGQRNPFIQFFMNLHFDLLNGKLGRTMNGVGAACLFIILVTGLTIWFRGTKGIKKRLKIDFKANWKRINFDTHTAVSIWAVPFILIWATSGFYFGFPQVFKKAASFVLDGQSKPKQSVQYKPLSTREDTRLESSIVLAEARCLGLKTRWIKISKDSSKPVKMLLCKPENTSKDKMTELFFSPRSGEIKSIITPDDRPLSNNFIQFLKKLHFGSIFGVYSKTFWVLIGLFPGILFVTGFLINKNRK